MASKFWWVSMTRPTLHFRKAMNRPAVEISWCSLSLADSNVSEELDRVPSRLDGILLERKMLPNHPSWRL